MQFLAARFQPRARVNSEGFFPLFSSLCQVTWCHMLGWGNLLATNMWGLLRTPAFIQERIQQSEAHFSLCLLYATLFQKNASQARQECCSRPVSQHICDGNMMGKEVSLQGKAAGKGEIMNLCFILLPILCIEDP